MSSKTKNRDSAKAVCPRRALKGKEPLADVISKKTSADEPHFGVRFANLLEDLDIRTIGELTQKTEADLLRKASRKTVKEIKELLAGVGMSLRED